MTASHREIESAFTAALHEPGAQPPAPITRHAGGNPPTRRFNVYRNNVYAGLIGVLEARFPATQRLVGEEFFRAAARLHIEADPPRSPVLIAYGNSFPDFLASFEPAADVPYLADVARLEWLIHCAAHAADIAPVTAEELGGIPPQDLPSLKLVLAPAVGLLASPYPVFSLWRANTSPETESGAMTFSGAEDVLVTRPALEVEVVRLAPGQQAFIAALGNGDWLGIAFEAGNAAASEFRFDITLALLLRSGAIRAFTSDNGNSQEISP